MHVIVVPNHKGGVGKTTTVLNLAPALAERGLRVLIVELDPQANVGEGLGLEAYEGPWIEELLLGPGAPELAPAAVNVGELLEGRGDQLTPDKAQAAARLSVLPASLLLRERQGELDGRPERLRELLEASADDWDVVLIDPPPLSTKALHDLALMAADHAIIPVQPMDYDVMSAQKQWAYIEQVLADDNPELQVLGVLAVRAQRRRRLFRDSEDALEQAGLPTIPTHVPERTNEISEAVRSGVPTFLGQPKAAITSAYGEVADFVATALALAAPAGGGRR